jgi:hypothetical protein
MSELVLLASIASWPEPGAEMPANSIAISLEITYIITGYGIWDMSNGI